MTKLLTILIALSLTIVTACSGKNEVSKKTISVPKTQITYEQYDSKDEFYENLNKIITSKIPSEATPDDPVYSITSSPLSENIYEIKESGEYMGGAYPNPIYVTTYYNKNPFKKVTGIDVFKVEKINEVAKFIIDTKRKEVGEESCLSDVSIEGAANRIKDGEFSLSQKTFDIDFDLPHACKAFDGVSIPWELLSKNLTASFADELKKFTVKK